MDMQVRLTKRQRQAIETKKHLFETAVRLFNEKGYDNVTVEEITSQAGVAKGSFYTYFRSKSEIVIEEFRNIDDYYRKYARNLKRYPTAQKRIVAFTRAQLKYVRDVVDIKLLKLLYVNNIAVPDSEHILIDTDRYLHHLMREMIEFGQERGELRSDVSAETLSLYVNRAMRSMFLDWAISDAGFDLVTEGVRFCEVVLCPALLSGARAYE
ncbi:MAG: TetR/AcrR family transcriptional regulator [Spirochaetales bacterium]|nr:TetR/AcrR family transcriptional regulator [Spirochaetales bacterium]